jgi:hypothetical protein
MPPVTVQVTEHEQTAHQLEPTGARSYSPAQDRRLARGPGRAELRVRAGAVRLLSRGVPGTRAALAGVYKLRGMAEQRDLSGIVQPGRGLGAGLMADRR